MGKKEDTPLQATVKENDALKKAVSYVQLTQRAGLTRSISIWS